MAIGLWVLQVLIAIFCVMGAMWRFSNFEQAAKSVASIRALSRTTWNVIGIFEVLCALGLILPGLLGVTLVITTLCAAALCIELLLITALHVRFFSLTLRATNPAVWAFSFAILSGILALARY